MRTCLAEIAAACLRGTIGMETIEGMVLRHAAISSPTRARVWYVLAQLIMLTLDGSIEVVLGPFRYPAIDSARFEHAAHVCSEPPIKPCSCLQDLGGVVRLIHHCRRCTSNRPRGLRASRSLWAKFNNRRSQYCILLRTLSPFPPRPSCSDRSSTFRSPSTHPSPVSPCASRATQKRTSHTLLGRATLPSR